MTIDLLYGRGTLSVSPPAGYYQTVKGMVGPLDILERGGDLIVASACSEGMGSKHYVESLRRLVDLRPDGFQSSIEEERHADIDEWQTQMQLEPMRAGRVRIYTDGLDERDAALTGVERVTDLTAAVADSMARRRDPRSRSYPKDHTWSRFMPPELRS